VKVLLDTVALYRAVVSPEALPDRARSLLEEENHQIFVSLASAWELAIKASLGKLALPRPVDEFFPKATRDLLARQLSLELGVIARLVELPHHHRDPFDRLIIAQALVDDLAVMTSDRRFAEYGVTLIWGA
jgi:PIN domain nuclease of toxin-antitoxin system